MSDRDPFSEIERAFDVLGGQLDVGTGSVPTDIVDEGDRFVVRADLPGFDGDDIDVQLVENQRLTVTASRDEERTSGDGRYVQRERRRQSASRTVRLPEAVAESETSATYDDGVLTVTLPKAAGSGEGTDIPVN